MMRIFIVFVLLQAMALSCCGAENTEGPSSDPADRSETYRESKAIVSEYLYRAREQSRSWYNSAKKAAGSASDAVKDAAGTASDAVMGAVDAVREAVTADEQHEEGSHSEPEESAGEEQTRRL